jgi:hypothetical protein
LTWPGTGSITKYNDLLREKVYDQPTWRRIQVVGDLRNKAAHGEGATLRQETAQGEYEFIGRFLTEHPA